MERDQADRLIALAERIATALERLTTIVDAERPVTYSCAPQWLIDEMKREAGIAWRDEEAKREGESYIASQAPKAEPPEPTPPPEPPGYTAG